MSWKFNPPPGWPPQPEGWVPPPGWTPDPSWPPAPEGWEFWVPADDPAPGGQGGGQSDTPGGAEAASAAAGAGAAASAAPAPAAAAPAPPVRKWYRRPGAVVTLVVVLLLGAASGFGLTRGVQALVGEANDAREAVAGDGQETSPPPTDDAPDGENDEGSLPELPEFPDLTAPPDLPDLEDFPGEEDWGFLGACGEVALVQMDLTMAAVTADPADMVPRYRTAAGDLRSIETEDSAQRAGLDEVAEEVNAAAQTVESSPDQESLAEAQEDVNDAFDDFADDHCNL